MTLIALSLGSNLEREKHICFALDELEKVFGELETSPVYQAKSVGFNGPDFLNLVVVVESELSLDAIIKQLQSIETEAGRVRGSKTYASRNLDIDVLLYGDQNLRAEGRNIPRDEIERNAYVLIPLADLMPDGVHPVLGERYDAMRDSFSDERQTLEKISLSCVGRY